MAEEGGVKPITRKAAAHDQIRRDIILGRWEPGAKLQTNTLAEHYKTSTTVIREALTRLAGESFVAVEPNRGFFIPRLSMSELRDLTEVRCVNETLAIELAIERGDLSWESEVIAAHHQLSRTPRRNPDNPHQVTEEWSLVHSAFHAKLIEASKVPVLIRLARQLSNATDLYRRWAAPSSAAATRDVEKEHADILEAVLARNTNLASGLLRRHYEGTIDVVFASGLLPEVEVVDS